LRTVAAQHDLRHVVPEHHRCADRHRVALPVWATAALHLVAIIWWSVLR